MRPDPFAIKSKPKWHPGRIIPTLQMRYAEQKSRWQFDQYTIPEKVITTADVADDVEWKDTAVTPLQMGHLLAALQSTEKFADTVVVEIGSFRGVTTRRLAGQTSRKFIAIDPFFNGYGGSDDDHAKFQARIAGLPNVTLLRKTSGQAFGEWNLGKVSFVFIDAVHDYANTAYDLDAWSSLTVPGGIIAMHDTDNRDFAGTRRAVFEGLKQFDLYAHVENLVIFVKRD